MGLEEPLPDSLGVDTEVGEVLLGPSSGGVVVDGVEEGDQFRRELPALHWAAAVAGAVSGFEGPGGGRIEFNVFAFGFTSRATGATENSGRPDGGDKSPIGLRVPLEESTVALVGI